MDENEIIDELQRAGTEPVPAEVEHAHLSRLAATATARATGSKRFGRLAVAGAAIVGFLAGSTGFAVAGALPDPAQDVAHDVLSVVQVEVPEGREGKRGPCVSAIAKSDLPKEEKKAAKAECPKGPFGPDDSDEADAVESEGEGRGRPEGAGPPDGVGPPDHADKHADDPCRGRPPWAGQPDMTAEEKERLEAERAAACGKDLDDEDEEPENEPEDDGEG